MGIEMNYSKVRENLFLTLAKEGDSKIDPENNVYINKGGMLIVPSVGREKDEILGTYKEFKYVTNEMLISWRVDKERCIDDAYENSNALFNTEIKPVEEYLNNRTGILRPDGDTIPELYVLTNRQHFCGSLGIFTDKELLADLAGKAALSELAVIPVSEDFAFCIPINSTEQKNALEHIYNDFCEYFGIAMSMWQGIGIYDAQRDEITFKDGSSIDLELNEEQVYNRSR